METTTVFGSLSVGDTCTGRQPFASTAMGTGDVEDPSQTATSPGFANAQKKAIERVGRGPVKGRVVKGRPIEEWTGWFEGGLRVVNLGRLLGE